MLVELQHLSKEAAEVAATPVWSLSEPELNEFLQATHHLEQVFAGLQLRAAREADKRGVPRAQGHPTLARWLRAQLLLDARPAREMADRAVALGERPAVEQALLDGWVDVRQAAVIADAVNAVPQTLDEAGLPADARLQQLAETTMIDMAGEFSPFYLRKIGDRILAHVAPEIAERVEEAALQRQEARAHARRSLTLSAAAGGLVRLTGTLGVEEAAIVQAALQPLCHPVTDDERTPDQLRADALIAVCRLALRTGELPEHGGEPPQLAVTVAYDPLTGALGSGDLDTGDRVSAGTARRLACDARILPVVLGSAGQVLDVGRASRLATTSIRRALTVRDRGCAFPGCDQPPRWTEAHHILPWEAGGTTSVDDMVLQCGHHHRLLHDPGGGWQVRMGADRLPDFIPPPWIDPQQRPRRNRFHPRTGG
ncbi:HNH endonuclease signature motif containing protein [Actinoplanes sp. N902-109]|uniref:HNH endonuclease signature motif containing protein n=1 Tax=Actinoplanes sp. (strain N902-109) TaxID=649831 RepID=UPI0003294C7E|nr:HNH endonuclease signature motif containing protein [Actinoplanes sp. N902-109]AGL18840.1 HNH nuclease [Actinoplanes sp. N902-109]